MNWKVRVSCDCPYCEDGWVKWDDDMRPFCRRCNHKPTDEEWEREWMLSDLMECGHKWEVIDDSGHSWCEDCEGTGILEKQISMTELAAMINRYRESD